MTNDQFKQLVKDFYKQNKYLRLMDVVAAVPGNHKCQACGNRHVKRLCQVRNEERGQDWFIGWECWSAVDALQEKEQRKAFSQMIPCSKCGNESLRGVLMTGAYAAGLCNGCWVKENGIQPIVTGISMPVPIKEV